MTATKENIQRNLKNVQKRRGNAPCKEYFPTFIINSNKLSIYLYHYSAYCGSILALPPYQTSIPGPNKSAYVVPSFLILNIRYQVFRARTIWNHRYLYLVHVFGGPITHTPYKSTCRTFKTRWSRQLGQYSLPWMKYTLNWVVPFPVIVANEGW